MVGVGCLGDFPQQLVVALPIFLHAHSLGEAGGYRDYENALKEDEHSMDKERHPSFGMVGDSVFVLQQAA